jgi:hypothetical protein
MIRRGDDRGQGAGLAKRSLRSRRLQISGVADDSSDHDGTVAREVRVVIQLKVNFQSIIKCKIIGHSCSKKCMLEYRVQHY